MLKRYHSFWGLVLMVFALHAQSAEPSRPQPPSDVLRVMSYNIRCGSCEKPDDVNHWSRRKYLVAELIRAARVDLIGLQEAELFQVKDLVEMLADFDWVGLGRDDGKEKGEMNAVLVRRSAFSITSQKTLWLSETPDRVSRGWDAMFNRTVSVLQLKDRKTGKPLHFLNTHLDHMGVQARNESARLIVRTVRELGPDARVIVTGDLNARPESESYAILARPLKDAFTASATSSTGDITTFNGFGNDLQAGNKIDYVFVDPGQTVQSHKIITDRHNGLYPSDHFAVLVELRRP